MRKFTTRTILNNILAGLFIGLMLSLPTFGSAAEKRLDVGFTTDEMRGTPGCDMTWLGSPLGQILWPLVFDQLWMMGPAPDYEALPRLAEYWETTDHKTWRFELRQDALFHDGQPITAEDVVFSLRDLPKVDGYDLMHNTNIIGYRAVDDRMVEITLDAPHGGPYPPVYQKPILPKRLWDICRETTDVTKRNRAIGSGMFRLAEFVPGQHITLVKNEDYWGLAARFEEIRFRGFENSPSMIHALKIGLIGMLSNQGLATGDVSKLKGEMGVEVITTPDLELNWLSFNMANPQSPLGDLRVRRAIMHAINKQEIIDNVYDGYAREVTSFVYDELGDYNGNVPQYAPDRNKAERFLEKAGVVDTDGDGVRNNPRTQHNLTLRLMVPNTWPHQLKIAQQIQQQLKRIDLNLSITPVSLETYWEAQQTVKTAPFEIALNRLAPGPHSDWMWGMMRRLDNGGRELNHSGYGNLAFERIMDQANLTTDLEHRRKYLYLMQEILADDVPYGLLVRPLKISAYRSDQVLGVVDAMGGISSAINPWTYMDALPFSQLTEPPQE